MCFLDRPADAAWSHLTNFAEALESAGIGRVVLAAPFTPAIPGTDTYADQLY